ncbi:T9SS type A sorting domain-containing protein [Pleomorphovibrio marinus]|uniref:T9SS type A sorting domain-containing protein n=1 Tax=Pleomorphovibrio marinus TaxID=2164132 RepID=UPI000E0A8D56|nr:T9SS type A sorting domain-containing protein [Pleomorphovibrio marinus]
MRFAFIIFLVFWWQGIFAQHVYRYDSELPVIQGGIQLSMPWVGGINAAQVQTMDVTGDGVEEFVVWDINARQVNVFTGEPGNFVHLPNKSHYFPSDISGFMVLADFDGDGRKDLFTGSPFGIKAYRNITAADQSHPEWVVAQDFLRLENGSNVTANSLDIPLLMDIDGDGDLDILTFNFATGDYLEYYQNTSMERKGERDIDAFASAQIRWGRFEFCGCGNISFGLTCGGLPIAAAPNPITQLRIQHAGGHSMLYADLDGDGVKDLLMGQDECNTLYFLPNKGSDEQPVFESFTNSLPGIGPLPQFPIFHAAYLVRDQLIISSHTSEPAGVFGIDFGQSVYQYPFPAEEAQLTEGFFQSDMLDFGENSRPFFGGNTINGNLIIASNRLVEGRVRGQASLFSLEEGGLIEQEEDYLGLSKLSLRELTYQQWRSAEGQEYHIVTGDIVENNIPRKRVFWRPVEGVGEYQSSAIAGFDLRGVDHLYFFSLGGADYLLLGRQTGELVLMTVEVQGDSMQTEVLERDFLGFSDNPVNRGLSISVHAGESPILYAVDQRGIIRVVRDFMENPSNEALQLQLEEGLATTTTRMGRNAWITPVPDAFGERVDLIVGTRAGGVNYLKDLGSSALPPEGERLRMRLFPNPTRDRVVVISNSDAIGTLVGMNGQIILKDIEIREGVEQHLQLLGLAPGVYVLQLRSEEKGAAAKRIMLRP